MSDKPCTHCGGSGEEPDAIACAWQVIEAELALLPMGSQAGVALSRAATAYRDLCAARITFLEAALRDILGRFPAAPVPGSVATQPRPCTWQDVSDWRAILDGTPGVARCGTCGRTPGDRHRMPCCDCPLVTCEGGC